MNFIYSSDEKFAMILAVSLESLYEAHTNCDECNVYVINNGLSQTSQDKLKRIASSHKRTLCITENVSSEKLADTSLSCKSTWSPAAYSRLFIGSLFPCLNKAIYLDCDVIVRKELSSLWNTDLESYSCAAVYEPFGKLHKKAVGQTVADHYINSGVMLIDIANWRTHNLQKNFIEYIQQKNGSIPFVDQGVLNNVLKNSILRLPFTYNCMTIFFDFGYDGTSIARGATNDYSQQEVESALSDPHIVHFTSSYVSNRPWLINSEHPYTKEWLEIKSKTPWADASLWEDTRGVERRTCRWIYEHMPKAFGYWFSYIVNGVMRPFFEQIVYTAKYGLGNPKMS